MFTTEYNKVLEQFKNPLTDKMIWHKYERIRQPIYTEF
jgi:hypothetical protein